MVIAAGPSALVKCRRRRNVRPKPLHRLETAVARGGPRLDLQSSRLWVYLTPTCVYYFPPLASRPPTRTRCWPRLGAGHTQKELYRPFNPQAGQGCCVVGAAASGPRRRAGSGGSQRRQAARPPSGSRRATINTARYSPPGCSRAYDIVPQCGSALFPSRSRAPGISIPLPPPSNRETQKHTPSAEEDLTPCGLIRFAERESCRAVDPGWRRRRHLLHRRGRVNNALRLYAHLRPLSLATANVVHR